MARRLTAAERKIADDILAYTLDLNRLDAHMRNNALRILRDLETQLKRTLNDRGPMTEFSKASTDRLLLDIKNITDKYYGDLNRLVTSDLQGVAGAQGEVIRTTLAGVGYGPAIAPATHFATALTDVLIQGAPSAEWWSRQSADTAFKFSNLVRQGIVQGDTNQQIIRGVEDIMTTSRANIAALVQTSVQTVANESRMETFRQNADIISGVMQLSTLDSHTTDICMAYSGAEWNLEEDPIGDNKLPFNGGPPRHWNCRSVLVPITKSFAELGLDKPEMSSTQRASTDGPIEANTTFASFLDRKGEAFQDEILGAGRAEMWRDGKITLPQLLDQRGNPLTLAELKAKYG